MEYIILIDGKWIDSYSYYNDKLTITLIAAKEHAFKFNDEVLEIFKSDYAKHHELNTLNFKLNVNDPTMLVLTEKV